MTRRFSEDNVDILGKHIAAAGNPSQIDPGSDQPLAQRTSSSSASDKSTAIVSHDSTDWVSIRMGSSLSSLSLVTSVKNVMNDDLGEVST